ncbi:MAG TPA: inner-membrane translocator [Ktedonobacteraceae bacterium]|nr:inner-membrane translocator [Ktedonobacteraceae bacterium]
MSDTIEKDDPSGSSSSVVATSVEVPTTAAVPQKRTARDLLRGDLGFIPVLITLIVIMAYFTIASGGIFLKPENLSNLVLQIATIGIIGLGEIMVLLLGEIDLSVAAVSVFCAVVMAVLSERVGVPGVVAILVALLAGALVGFINGFFIAYLRVPSFIVTLAASIFYSGLLLNLLAGQSTLIIRDPIIVGIAGTPISFLPDIFGIGLPFLGVLLYALSVSLNFMRRRRAGLRTVSLTQLILQIVIAFVIVLGVVTLFQSYQGVPYATAILVALIVLFWIILTKTPFGRHVYAVGGNNEAARRAGINVVGIRMAVFTLCSTLAAVGGIVQASRGLAVASQIDPVLLLNAIAAAVIGGVSLFGGRGSVWAIVLGGLIIGSLVNGLALLNQGTDVAEMVEGIVLLLAVTIDAVARRLQARSGR